MSMYVFFICDKNLSALKLFQITSKLEPGHSQDRARMQPGHSQDTVRIQPGQSQNIARIQHGYNQNTARIQLEYSQVLVQHVYFFVSEVRKYLVGLQNTATYSVMYEYNHVFSCLGMNAKRFSKVIELLLQQSKQH